MDIDHILKDKKLQVKLNKDLLRVLNQHSGLMVHYERNVPKHIYGAFRIFDDNGVEQGNWDIKIPIPENYPYEFPQLIETSKKIKASEDTHMDEFGKACTELDIIAEKVALKGISLYNFIQSYVVKYFSWQILYASGEHEQLESWEHHYKGKLQFFFEKLNTTDFDFVRKCMEAIKERRLPKRNEPCICDSNVKFKRCHLNKIGELGAYSFPHLEKQIEQILLAKNEGKI